MQFRDQGGGRRDNQGSSFFNVYCHIQGSFVGAISHQVINLKGITYRNDCKEMCDFILFIYLVVFKTAEVI